MAHIENYMKIKEQNMSEKFLCTVIVIAYAIAIINAIIGIRKDKKELKEMEDRLKL
jgi:hypothetical protein